MLAPRGWEGELFYTTDDRKPVIAQVSVHRSQYSRGSDDSWGGSVNLEWKPAAAVSVKIGPEFDRSRSAAQYVWTSADPAATSTFGNRYVFADLAQTTVSANVRLNWTFSPSLSLELYAQPLLSSGDYHQYKEFARPRSYEFRQYGTDGSTITPVTSTSGEVVSYQVDPDGNGTLATPFTFDNADFNFASLRGNAVLRWEYSPGSTLFLVWTQDRSAESFDGDFSLNRSLRQLGRAHGNHIFAVKVTYWWHP
jgi:hypothetical protein